MRSHRPGAQLLRTIQVICILSTVSLLAARSSAAAGLQKVRVVTRDGRGSADAVAGQLLVQFHKRVPLNRRNAVVRQGGGSVLRWLHRSDMAVVQLRANVSIETARRQYLSHAAVADADANYICRPLFIPNDPRYPQQTAPPQIHAPEAWDIQRGSASVVVAVLDTGVDLDHEDFGGDNRGRVGNRIWTNTAETPNNNRDDDNNGFIDDYYGWDFYDSDKTPTPPSNSAEDDHGTHVAGIIGATGNNGKGIAGLDWNCKIMALRVLGPDGGPLDVVIDAIDYAVANGADVINMSLGFDTFISLLDTPIGRAVANNAVVVAAAGNTNQNISQQRMSPVCNDGTTNWVIGVAAVDANDVKWNFTPAVGSNFQNPGDTFVDVSAPGVNILSLLFQDPTIDPTGALYGTMSGTSQAAPHVAGMAALLRAHFPTLTAGAIVQRIRQSTDNIDAANPTFPPGALGTGRINLYQAFEVTVEFGARVEILAPLLNEVVYNLSPTILAFFTYEDPASAPDDPFDFTTLQIYITGLLKNEGSLGTQVVKDGKPVGPIIDGQPVGLYGNLQVDETARLAKFLPIALSRGLHAVTIEIKDQAAVINKTDPLTATVKFTVSQKVLPPGLQMFTVPYHLRNNQTHFVLGALILPIMARYDPSLAQSSDPYHYYQPQLFDPYVSQFQPGRSYWLQDNQARTLNVEADDVSILDDFTFTTEVPQSTQGNSRFIAGWHMIASPFPFAIDIPNILFERRGQILSMIDAVQQGIIGNAFWTYDIALGDYRLQDPRSGVMQPFAGYWMQVKQQVDRMFVPPVRSPSRSVRNVTRSLNTPRAEKGNVWQLQVTASAGESKDTQNFIGFAPDACDDADISDVMQPPVVPNSRVQLSLPRWTWGADSGYYARDVRKWPLTRQQVFDFEVSTDVADIPVRLAWDNMTQLPRNVRLTLVDVDAQKRLYMRTTQGYTYTSANGASRRFQIIVDPNPGALMRVSNISVQSGSRSGMGMRAQFTLTQDAMVQAIVRTLTGKVVRAGPSMPGRMGVNMLQWDLRDALGRIVPRGVYILEIVATTEENQVGRGVRTVTVR